MHKAYVVVFWMSEASLFLYQPGLCSCLFVFICLFVKHVQPLLLIQGGRLKWSLWQPWQRETAHYGAMSWKVNSTAERVLSVEGQMRVG